MHQTKDLGIRKSFFYGYVPCLLGLCGPKDEKKKKIIKDYLNGSRKGAEKIKEILKEFKGAYPYYELIAKCNDINDPFDLKVIEAYWTGNSLLEKVSKKDFQKMIKDHFAPLGELDEKKIKHLPEGSLPFHLFHVLYIGSVTGVINFDSNAQNICRTSWGKVREIKKDKLIIDWIPLLFEKKISIGKRVIRKEINWNKLILPEIKEGDWISVHWNTAIEILDDEKLSNLFRYTQKTLDIINSQ